MRHARDPAAAHRAAAVFGRLLAAGLLDPGEPEQQLRQTAANAAGVDRSGLQSRLLHTLGDHHWHCTLRRDRAIARVHQATVPLLDAWAPAAAVLRAAHAAAGDDLQPGEAAEIAADLAVAILRRY